jgi:hypothetical protein
MCHKFPCGGPILQKPGAKKKKKRERGEVGWSRHLSKSSQQEREWRGWVGLGTWVVPVLSCRLLGGSIRCMVPVFDHPLINHYSFAYQRQTDSGTLGLTLGDGELCGP